MAYQLPALCVSGISLFGASYPEFVKLATAHKGRVAACIGGLGLLLTGGILCFPEAAQLPLGWSLFFIGCGNLWKNWGEKDDPPFLVNISYSAHKELNNEGPLLSVNKMDVTEIMAILKSKEKHLDDRVNESHKIISFVLEKTFSLETHTGIFIHGFERGYLLIMGPPQKHNLVLSIKI